MPTCLARIVGQAQGYLAFFRQVVKDGRRAVLPGERIFRMKGISTFDQRHTPDEDGPKNAARRLNQSPAGRRTCCFTDWDGDGRVDLFVNTVNANWLRNVAGKPGEWIFEDMGAVSDRHLAGHSTAPGIVDWDRDGIPDLLIGAEDGHFYYLKNSGTK